MISTIFKHDIIGRKAVVEISTVENGFLVRVDGKSGYEYYIALTWDSVQDIISKYLMSIEMIKECPNIQNSMPNIAST